MHSFSQVAGSLGPTTLFVLLWSSGALFARWGLDHASPFAFLCMRFGLALAVLSLVAWRRGAWWPRSGTRGLTAGTGAVLVGGYSVFYLLALDRGVTPGLLATILGVQPLATLACTERPLQRKRFAGLGLALAGLAMVVLDSLLAARAAPMGLVFALLALACMTAGTLMQKRLQQSPVEVLPMQYTVALAMCAAMLPFETVRVEWTAGLFATVAWLGVVISVAATLLLYRLIAAGNLVNVTSLFYLVPAGTAALDWLVFGHRMAPVALAGTGAVLAGLVLVYRTPAATSG
jgi:drug/metabolite transporter (DMT)-like permease